MSELHACSSEGGHWPNAARPFQKKTTMDATYAAIRELFPNLRFNLIKQEVEYGAEGESLPVKDLRLLYILLTRGTGQTHRKRRTKTLASMIAWDNRHNPVQDFLHGCAEKASPYPHFQSIATNLLGSMPTGRAEEILSTGPDQGRWIPDVIIERFFIAAVARTLNPGCRLDTMLILNAKGYQGQCSFFEQITAMPEPSTRRKPWLVFRDNKLDSIQKDPFSIHQSWITVVDTVEMRAQGCDLERFRDFLIQRHDTPDRRHITTSPVPRHCVLTGVSYGKTPANPEHGRPCFLPVNVATHSPINFDRLTEERSAIWSAAYRAHLQQSPYLFTEAELRAMKPYLAQFPSI